MEGIQSQHSNPIMRREGAGGGGVGSVGKSACCSSEPNDLTLDPQCPLKNWAWLCAHLQPSTGEWRREDHQGLLTAKLQAQ